MTDQDQRTDESDGESAEKKSKKVKLMVIASAGLVMLLGGGAGAAYFLGLFSGDKPAGAAMATHGDEYSADASSHGSDDDGHAMSGSDDEHAADGHAQQADEGIVFVDLPDVLVNLHSSGKRMRFLKMRVALEASDQNVANSIKKLMPRIMDSFQMYLRALTIDEVSNPASLHRLKEELTARTNYAISPNRIDDVLVKELLVQ